MPSPPNPLGLHHGWRMLWDNITSEGNVTECRCLKSCKPILPKFLLAIWCVKWPGWQKQDAHARRSGLHHLARHVITTARNLKSTVGLWMGHGFSLFSAGQLTVCTYSPENKHFRSENLMVGSDEFPVLGAKNGLFSGVNSVNSLLNFKAVIQSKIRKGTGHGMGRGKTLCCRKNGIIES